MELQHNPRTCDHEEGYKQARWTYKYGEYWMNVIKHTEFSDGRMGGGHLGIWAALRAVYPEAEEQRCWNHKILNILDKLPIRQQQEAKALVCQIPYAATRREA
jgi:transposase-like protein